MRSAIPVTAKTVVLNLDLHRVRRLAKEGGWIALGQIATMAGTLVLVRVLTGFLDPAQYGQLALGMTVATLANQVITGGITNGISRYYAIAAERHDMAGYLRASARLVGCAVVVTVALGSALILGLHSLGFAQWTALVAAAVALSVLVGCNSAMSGIQNAARQRAIVALHAGGDAWLKIAFAVAAMLWLGSTGSAVIVGYCCSAVVVTTSQLLFLRRTVRAGDNVSSRDWPWAYHIWSFSWPFSIWGIFTWMQQVSDRLALSTFASIEATGTYAVLFQLGYSPIIMATTLMSTLIAPILYQRAGDASDQARHANVHALSWRIAVTALLMTAIVVIVASLFHEWLFRLLVAEPYRYASYLLPWINLAGGLFAVGQILSLKLMSEMRSAQLMLPKVVTALLGVVLNVFGALLAGLIGVVAALVAFSFVYVGWIAVISLKIRNSANLMANIE